jgi:hypothetical protein
MAGPSAVTTGSFVLIVLAVAALFTVTWRKACTAGARPGGGSWPTVPLLVLAGCLALPGALARAGALDRYSPIALLGNIVVVAVLSTPVPFCAFTEGPPNLLPSTFPYVWLPTFLVQAALFGHLVVFRALARPERPPA